MARSGRPLKEKVHFTYAISEQIPDGTVFVAAVLVGNIDVIVRNSIEFVV